MNEYCLKLDEYEIANLISALEAGVGFCHSDPDVYARLRSPLTVLNSGDWIGMILNKLRPMCPDSKVRPNRTPEEYAQAARVFDRPARPQLSDDDLTVLEANFNTNSWNLTSEGEDAMLKVMDPQSDAGRPTAPSQAVPEVSMVGIRLARVHIIVKEWVEKQGHDRCWYYPDPFRQLAAVLGIEVTPPNLPSRPEFEAGCRRYQDEEYGK